MERFGEYKKNFCIRLLLHFRDSRAVVLSILQELSQDSRACIRDAVTLQQLALSAIDLILSYCQMLCLISLVGKPNQANRSRVSLIGKTKNRIIFFEK